MTARTENRIACIEVGHEVMLQILFTQKQGDSEHTFIVVQWLALPEDATVAGVYYLPEKQAWAIYIYSDEFEPVHPEYGDVPRLTAVIEQLRVKTSCLEKT